MAVSGADSGVCSRSKLCDTRLGCKQQGWEPHITPGWRTMLYHSCTIAICLGAWGAGLRLRSSENRSKCILLPSHKRKKLHGQHQCRTPHATYK
jgi:hypothetical protein